MNLLHNASESSKRKNIYILSLTIYRGSKLREVMPAIGRKGKAQRWKKGGNPPIISFSMNTSNVFFL